MSDAGSLLRTWLEYPTSFGPTVSADGKWLYFISNRGGMPQAWAIPIDGGTPMCVHPARENVGKIVACPKRSALVLSLDRGGNEHWQLFIREGDPSDGATETRSLTNDPAYIHEPGAWRDTTRFVFASNRRDLRFFDVYETNVDGNGEPRLLRKEDSLLSVVAAGEQRVLLHRSNTNLDSDLILLEGERDVVLTPHSGELTVRTADLAKRDVYAGANPNREFAALVRYVPDDTPEIVGEFDGDVESLRTDPTGDRIAFSVNRQGPSELHLLDLKTNEDAVLTIPDTGVITSIAWNPDGSRFVFDYSSPNSGREIWLYDVASRQLRPVTKSPVPMPGETVTPTLHSYFAQDGLEVPYWEYAPKSGQVRGTILSVHGGPESQARPVFGSGIYAFLVSEGWRVIEPNVRGSTGYGRSYVHRDDVRKRMDSVRDLRDLVHVLVASGTALRGSVAIWGESYGGFMVLAALTTYPDLWGAAAEFFGISNFVTFLERTSPWRRKVREAEYGSLTTDREFLEAISPIHQVDRITTPLLVAHGQNDTRVPVAEAEQIVEALKIRNVPVEFLRYTNEGHGFTRIENQVDSLGKVAEFLARHIEPPAREPDGTMGISS
ncbi:MAG: alpha/beta hydrolase family protein [Thermoplasmata archaeon]